MGVFSPWGRTDDVDGCYCRQRGITCDGTGNRDGLVGVDDKLSR